MLGANPGHVKSLVTTDLPRDRTLAIRETEPFVRGAASLRRVLGS